MRLTLLGLVCLTFLSSRSLFADSIGTVSLIGRYDGPNVAACTGTTTCQASNSLTIATPYIGPLQMQAGIDATASFSGPTDSSDPASRYGWGGTPISAGSYLLNGSLNTLQGASYGQYSLQQNPEVRMNATFNVPVDSGAFQIRAFFQEGGDSNAIPGDNLLIATSQGSYNLSNTFCTSFNSCNGGPNSVDFTLLHTPGTSDAINFYAYSSAWYTGTDSANFQVILTDLDAPLSETPEPGTLALIAVPLAALLLQKRRKLT